jgi:hypothetical protein
MQTMKVKDLKAALASYDDESEVVINIPHVMKIEHCEPSKDPSTGEISIKLFVWPEE